MPGLDVEAGMAAGAAPLDQPRAHRVKALRLAASFIARLTNAAICAGVVRRRAAADRCGLGSASIRMIVWFLSSTSQIAPSAATVADRRALGRTPFTLCQPEISST